MNERVFHSHADRLRTKERVDLLDLGSVITLSTEGLNPESVIDIGTGTVLFAEAFAQNGLSIAGIDINQAMIAFAERLLPQGTFKVGAAESIPFPDKSFDLAFFGHVLHEVDDLVAALSEARRVARKRIVILEWPYVEESMGPPFGHRLDPETLKTGAPEAGIKDKIEVIPMKHMVLYRIDLQ